MSVGIPSNYAGASGGDADANAMLALALAKWARLSATQQDALVDASMAGTPRLAYDVREPTVLALIKAYIVEDAPENSRHVLTGLGLMVREAGALTRESSS